MLNPDIFKKVQKNIDLSSLIGFGFTKFCLYTEQHFVVSNASKHSILTKEKRDEDEIRYSPISKEDLSNLLCCFKEFDYLKMIIRIETSDNNAKYSKEK